MRLPSMKYAEGTTKQQTVKFLGVNFGDDTQEGEFSACKNLSCRRYPYLATRLRRQAVGDYTAPTAVTAWNKLVVVDGTSLIFDGKSVGTVTAGKKQFACVNTKLVIWPDKKYLDLMDNTLHDLGAKASQAGATFTTDTVTMSSVKLNDLFSVGDAVSVSGCTVQTSNNKSAVIKAVGLHTVTFSENSLAAATETAVITIERKIPDLDYICESENRLWGASNSEKTIYASALGDPKNFFVYQGISTDSYALAVGSAGNFTGCCKLSSSVLFWKDNLLHKILGSYPGEYALYTSNITGVQNGSNKSMQVINDTLFYKGPDGVYAYSGGTPTMISTNFGRKGFTDAVAGTDGVRYYISMKSGGVWHLLVYDTQKNAWIEEDDTQAVDFCRYNSYLYLLSSDGSLWSIDADTGSEEIEWSCTFTPFYETAAGKKYYSRIYLRMELPTSGYVNVETRCDGRPWEAAGGSHGKTTAFLPIVPRRCDKFEIRLSGKGECTILSMVRQLRAGSEV